MKTPSFSLTSIALVICGLLAASPQALQAQKKGLPAPITNDNKNNNPKPVPVVKVVPRKVVKTKVKVEAVAPVPKQTIPPVQKRVEQPKLPPGMSRMGPGTASNEMRNLAKLKLMPPMKRKGNVSDSSFPQIGDAKFDRFGNRIHDIAFGQAANEIKDLGDVAGFVDLIGGQGEGPMLDFGLGAGSDTKLEDANQLVGGGDEDRFGGLGFFPDATAPQNKGGSAPNVGRGAPIRPGDPKDAAAGAASTHPSFSSAQVTNPGSLFTQIRRSDGRGGTAVESAWFDDRGNVHVVIDSYPGGSDASSRKETTYRDDGSATMTVTHYDEDGEVTSVELPSTGRSSEHSAPAISPDGNPDPDNADPDGKWARWMATNGIGRRPDLSMKTPNQVNPGDPDYEGAVVGGYLSIGAYFSNSIAVNPDPNVMTGGNRMPSERAWRLMVEDLKNGTGPGPKPGDPRGDR